MNKRAKHRRQCGQRNRLGTDGGRLDHGIVKIHPGIDLLANEINQQNRVAHDDAGQRNHPDHRGRGELRAE